MRYPDASPEVIRGINQRWLLRYWNELRGPALLPAWRGLQGRELSGMEQHLLFVDVVSSEYPRFLMRHHSRWIGEAYGSDCHGRFLDAMSPGRYHDAAVANYRQATAALAPVYAAVDLADPQGRLVHYERLLLPFSSDGRTVDRVLTSLEMVSPDGAFEHRGLIPSNTQAGSFSVNVTIRG